MRYKTKHFEINAFQFMGDLMPDWFVKQIDTGDVILHGCAIDEIGFDDRAFCVINSKSQNREVVSPGEYILESDYNTMIKMHPDKFTTKYIKNE